MLILASTPARSIPSFPFNDADNRARRAATFSSWLEISLRSARRALSSPTLCGMPAMAGAAAVGAPAAAGVSGAAGAGGAFGAVVACMAPLFTGGRFLQLQRDLRN